ncbi:dynein axonemal heavy chain 11 [Grus japonensis]|uniref:Dynein axonemal heavy chain 11 n=1 Tax=Grus japonensis TaxID=30415 RepID=A0ABC9WIQ8_GRUJA
MKFPSQGTLFDYYLDPEMRRFLPWVDKVPSHDVDPDAPLQVDLASLYIETGAKNMLAVFLLTDVQVPDECFLVLINDLLASGEVPDLFSDEDMEGIVTEVRKEV